MRIDVFSAKDYDRMSFEAENGAAGHDLRFLAPRLGIETVALAQGAGHPGHVISVSTYRSFATIYSRS